VLPSQIRFEGGLVSIEALTLTCEFVHEAASEGAFQPPSPSPQCEQVLGDDGVNFVQHLAFDAKLIGLLEKHCSARAELVKPTLDEDPPRLRRVSVERRRQGHWRCLITFSFRVRVRASLSAFRLSIIDLYWLALRRCKGRREIGLKLFSFWHESGSYVVADSDECSIDACVKDRPVVMFIKFKQRIDRGKVRLLTKHILGQIGQLVLYKVTRNIDSSDSLVVRCSK
jgi:hypothetical protein